MRWLSLFLVLMIIVVAVTSASAAELNGFRGFKWGTELKVFLGEEKKGVEGHMGAVPDVDAYQFKNEDLNVGGVKVNSIIYSFFKGKLTAVNIDFQGFDNLEKMRAYCLKLFGPAIGSATMRTEYYAGFDSPRTGALLLYQLTLPTASPGRLYLYSKELL